MICDILGFLFFWSLNAFNFYYWGIKNGRRRNNWKWFTSTDIMGYQRIDTKNTWQWLFQRVWLKGYKPKRTYHLVSGNKLWSIHRSSLDLIKEVNSIKLNHNSLRFTFCQALWWALITQNEWEKTNLILEINIIEKSIRKLVWSFLQQFYVNIWLFPRQTLATGSRSPEKKFFFSVYLWSFWTDFRRFCLGASNLPSSAHFILGSNLYSTLSLHPSS